MHNRPSFDPRFAHGQQAGGTVEQRQSAAGVPAMFLPNYSGDGRGVSKAASNPNPVSIAEGSAVPSIRISSTRTLDPLEDPPRPSNRR